MSSVAVAHAAVQTRPRARTKTTFYLALSVFMVGLVLAGFWPSYYGALLSGAADRPLIIHIHGAVFMRCSSRRSRSHGKAACRRTGA